MKNQVKKINLMAILSCCIITVLCARNPGFSDSKVTSNQVITVSQVRDVYDNLIIQAVVGAVGSDPATWMATTLSDGVSAINNSAPSIAANALGDIVVTWMYIDSVGVSQIAASILFHGTTIWYSATVSNGRGSASYADQVGSLNANGNAIVTWTAYRPETNTNEVLGVTALLSTSTIWSAPFVIVP